MANLYEKHFGFSQAPFNITPDPSFLYESESHREGLAQLLYGVNARRGFIVLTGEVGTGKTTLIQALLQRLSEGTQTALIFSSISSPTDLLRYVCEEFLLVEPMLGIKDPHDYIIMLNDFLLQKYRSDQNAALIIDEAQNLSPEVLESIRLLSNFETTKDKLLQIILVGQPELTERLNTPHLRQLKQRVTLRHQLRPLTLNETQRYIANRLTVAGGQPGIFPPSATEVIHQYAAGIPRLINVLCDNAMIQAYALDRRVIDVNIVHEVAADLHLAASPTRATPIRRETAITTEPRVAPRVEVVKSQSGAALKPARAESFFSEPVKVVAANDCVPENVCASLREALIDAMGPMAQVVWTEQAKLLGDSRGRIPRDKLGLLIESVSKEIFDDSMKERFRGVMSKHLSALHKT